MSRDNNLLNNDELDNTADTKILESINTLKALLFPFIPQFFPNYL